ncbi:MAG: hypothetical protein K2Z81_10345 [Cyanobacteria bacterium]|nr:hypothetical protein [Cyanobacteriota bacterium]
MKRELWLILFGSVGVLCALVVMLQGEPISISSQPADVKLTYFDPNHPPKAVGQDCRGITHWSFICPSQLSYQIVDEVSDPNGSFVRIKITGIKVDLALNIMKWLPEKASVDLEKHESGHADICLRVYEEAKSEARLGAKQIIGKVYSGNSTDTEAACQAAGDIAIKEFTEFYEEAIANKAQGISEIYDILSKKKHAQETLLDEAFKIYEEGKPRLISRSI